MNEFIVWDSDKKQFLNFWELKNILYLEKDNGIHCGNFDKNGDYYEMPMFSYVGKKDINNKKIYSDSSIIKVHDEKSRFCNDICKIKYCKNTC